MGWATSYYNVRYSPPQMRKCQQCTVNTITIWTPKPITIMTPKAKPADSKICLCIQTC